MIKLFEIENHTVKPTEHCYVINWLKAVMTQWPEPEDYLKIYAYIFYMSCPSQENPYHNVRFEMREEVITQDIDINFDTEDDVILAAINKATHLYETPTIRAHRGITVMLDNITDYMTTATVTAGRDGNIMAVLKLAKEFDDIRQSYKGVCRDLENEQQTSVRGGHDLSYDQV